MDYVDPDIDDENESYSFQPLLGDYLMRLKADSDKKSIFVWRIVLTDKNIKKIWPREDDGIDCQHKDLYWAIDFEKRFVTLCNDCQNFAFGHKVAEDE